MRAETPRQTMRLCAIAMALMFLLATVAYPGSQTRSTTRSSRRTQSQQNQTMSFQTGQPDMAQRIHEQNMRQMQEMQRNIEEMQRQAEENKNRAIQQTLRASDEQWRRLKPKMDRILQLKAEADVAISPGSAGGNGSFQTQTFTFGDGSAGGMSGSMGGGFGGFAGPGGSPGQIDILDTNSPSAVPSSSPAWNGPAWTSGSRSVMEMSEGEVLCQDLQRLLQGQSVPSAEVAQKVAALRRVRMQARDNLAKARQELRARIAPDQEPADPDGLSGLNRCSSRRPSSRRVGTSFPPGLWLRENTRFYSGNRPWSEASRGCLGSSGKILDVFRRVFRKLCNAAGQ